MGRTERGDDIAGASRYDPLLEKAALFYHRTLQRENEAFESLRRYGLSDADLIERFQIGSCDGSLLRALPDDETVRSTLLRLGILEEAEAEGAVGLQERMLGCLVFPLHDLDRGLVGLAGVPMDAGAPILLPTGPGIWNLPAAGDFPTMMAGLTVHDALSVYLAGYANTIAVLVETPRALDIELLEQSGVQQLHLISHEPLPIPLTQSLGALACYSRKLPESANRILCRRGAEELAAVLEASPRQEIISPAASGPVEVLEGGFAAVLGMRRYEVRGLDKSRLRLKATVRVEHGGRLHVDTIDFYSARSRRHLCRDLCGVFTEASHVIEADIHRLLLLSEAHDPDRADAVTTANVDPATLMTANERRAAEAFGKRPDLIERILADYRTCGLIGEECNKLLCYLAAISRKTGDPLSVLILSSSGAGKSALQDATLNLCPPEDVVKLTSLTGKALFYKGRHSIKHKVLALEEEAGAERADYAIRNLISAGELIVETTIKDSATGKLTTMENRVEGPTTVFITTTDPDVDPEMRSRFFVIGVDESREQTRAILASQRKRHARIDTADSPAIQATRHRHHNFQRLLKPIRVINPFAEKLDYLDDRLQSRRDQPKVLNLIRAVAFLRQMAKSIRTRTGDHQPLDYIEVDEQDLRIAGDVAAKVLHHGLDDVNQVSRDLLIHLDRMVTEKVQALPEGEPTPKTDVEFTRREIRAYTGWSNVRVHKYIQQLVELEYVYRLKGRGNHTHFYRLAREEGIAGLDRHPLSDWPTAAKERQP